MKKLPNPTHNNTQQQHTTPDPTPKHPNTQTLHISPHPTKPLDLTTHPTQQTTPNHATLSF